MGLARESLELMVARAQTQPAVRSDTARVERDNVASERPWSASASLGKASTRRCDAAFCRAPTSDGASDHAIGQ
jgi:hypothetical protein